MYARDIESGDECGLNLIYMAIKIIFYLLSFIQYI